MSEFWIVLAAVWGASGAIVVIIFALDERSHRRSSPTDDRSEAPSHGDRALV
jgi:hypothetical protein